MNPIVWIIDDQASSFAQLEDAFSYLETLPTLVLFSSYEELHMTLTVMEDMLELTPQVVFIDYYIDAPYTGSDTLQAIQGSFMNPPLCVGFSTSSARNTQLLQEGADLAIDKTTTAEIQEELRAHFPTVSSFFHE